MLERALLGKTSPAQHLAHGLAVVVEGTDAEVVGEELGGLQQRQLSFSVTVYRTSI